MTVGSKIRSGCQKNGWVANVAISGCLLYLTQEDQLAVTGERTAAPA